MSRYGVALISRLLKITGLFCKRALQKRLYSAKETYDFKEPTNRSHPINPRASQGHVCSGRFAFKLFDILKGRFKNKGLAQLCLYNPA